MANRLHGQKLLFSVCVETQNISDGSKNTDKEIELSFSIVKGVIEIITDYKVGKSLYAITKPLVIPFSDNMEKGLLPGLCNAHLIVKRIKNN